MELVFTKAGKYRNGINVLVVTKDDVENKTKKIVDANNGFNYITKGYAEAPVIVPEYDLEQLKKLKLPELKEHAERKNIDLGDAEKVSDVRKVVIGALFPEE